MLTVRAITLLLFDRMISSQQIYSHFFQEYWSDRTIINPPLSFSSFDIRKLSHHCFGTSLRLNSQIEMEKELSENNGFMRI